MARKIFYARRSKRTLVIALGIMCLCAGAFYSGFAAGRGHPNMFVFQSSDAPTASLVSHLDVAPVKLAEASH